MKSTKKPKFFFLKINKKTKKTLSIKKKFKKSIEIKKENLKNFLKSTNFFKKNLYNGATV